TLYKPLGMLVSIVGGLAANAAFIRVWPAVGGEGQAATPTARNPAPPAPPQWAGAQPPPPAPPTHPGAFPQTPRALGGHPPPPASVFGPTRR
uniref:DUF4235 domain-containing protein n=1 Tax=Nocardia brasiliensis TaxID=37326 RepID=UPI002457C9B8